MVSICGAIGRIFLLPLILKNLWLKNDIFGHGAATTALAATAAAT